MREARLLSKTSSCVHATSGAPGQSFKLHLVNADFAPSQFYVFDSTLCNTMVCAGAA